MLCTPFYLGTHSLAPEILYINVEWCAPPPLSRAYNCISLVISAQREFPNRQNVSFILFKSQCKAFLNILSKKYLTEENNSSDDIGAKAGLGKEK